MDRESVTSVCKILSKRDRDKVPNEVLVKVDKYIEQFLTTKVLYEKAQQNAGK